MAACRSPIRGQAGEWLFVTVASGLLVQVWFTPARLSMPLSLASGVAFWLGIVLAPGSHTARGARAASVALLFVVVGVHWCGRQMLYRRASRADGALAAADQDAREQFVILSRTVERREQDRLLHDTVLNTLTAVARSGPAGGIISRCGQDLARLERALSEPADPAGAFSRPVSGLVADLHAVAGEMRARGLAVQVQPEPGAADQSPAVPVPVAVAIAHATREALANVAAHAGNRRSLGHGPPAGRGGRRRRRGRGDGARRGSRVRPGPARPGPAGRPAVHHRAGHRLRWLGGGAFRPRRGHGGLACCWPCSEPEGRPCRGNAAATQGVRPVLTRDETVLASRSVTAGGAVAVGTESAAPLFVGALAVILPIGMLVQTLATLDDYRQPLAAVAVWLGILLAAAWLVPRALARGLSRPEAVAAIVRGGGRGEPRLAWTGARTWRRGRWTGRFSARSGCSPWSR